MRPAIVLTDRKFFVAPELFTVGCGELVLRALLAAGCITLEIVSGHEEHEEGSDNLSYSILRVLRALRGEKVFSEMREFGILHRKEDFAPASPSL
jgi:hypothetical protein